MVYQKRLYKTMSYRQLQSQNTKKIKLLSKDKRQWLKLNSYKNIGWDKVIQLYEKITEFLQEAVFIEMELENLFLEVDRIGAKYQTHEEINSFYKRLAFINQEISDEIDHYFPDDQL